MIVVYTFFQTTLQILTNLLPIHHLTQMSSPRGSNVALPLHLQSKSARRRARKKNARRRRTLTEESATSNSPRDASGSKARSSSYLTAAQEGPASAHKPLTPRAMSALLNPTATDDETRFAHPTSPPSSLDDADKQLRELNQTLDALRESRATQRLKLQHKSKEVSDHVRAVRAKEQQTNVRQYEMLSKLQDLEKLLAFVNTTRTDPTRWSVVWEDRSTTTSTSCRMLSSGFSTTKAAANELFEVPEYEPGYYY